jgi:hypothetical protein
MGRVLAIVHCAIIFQSVEFLACFAALVPRPRVNLARMSRLVVAEAGLGVAEAWRHRAS